MIKLNEFLTTERKQRGLSGKAMAAEIGVSQSLLYTLENEAYRKNHELNIKTANKIAVYFKKPLKDITDMAGFEGYKETPKPKGTGIGRQENQSQEAQREEESKESPVSDLD